MTTQSDSRLLATEIAKLFPPQGSWDKDDYLRLTDQSRCLVEFVDGTVEVLEMPTESHQLIVQFLFLAFHSVISSGRLGTLVFAPIRIQTGQNRFREPDLAFMLSENSARRTNDYWLGADLVVEVVSDDPASRRRDLQTKPAEYAQAGISEYWIVDPAQQVVRVFSLNQGSYDLIGQHFSGESTSSRLLPDLSIAVEDVWKAAAG